MSLVWLIVIGIVAYIGLQYLRTFQDMVAELRDMRRTCMKSSGDTDGVVNIKQASPIPGDLKERFVSILNYMKTSV